MFALGRRNVAHFALAMRARILGVVAVIMVRVIEVVLDGIPL